MNRRLKALENKMAQARLILTEARPPAALPAGDLLASGYRDSTGSYAMSFSLAVIDGVAAGAVEVNLRLRRADTAQSAGHISKRRVYLTTPGPWL